MSQKIKICGIRSSDVAKAALDEGPVDFLGIIHYEKSPRFVHPREVDSLLKSMPQGKRVAVDVNPTSDALRRYQDQGFDYFQIHFNADTPIENLEAWQNQVGREALWLAPKLNPEETFSNLLLDYSQTLLVDSYSKAHYGGSGTTGDWAYFNELVARYPETHFALAGGLSPLNIKEAMRSTKAWLYDINSGLETEPGVKSIQAVKKLFESIKSI